MTIETLWNTGAESRPVRFKLIDNWLRTYLQAHLLVADAVIARLDAWAREDGQPRQFPDWRSAAEAAAAELHVSPFRTVDTKSAKELQLMAKRATYLVQDMLVLAGSTNTGELATAQRDHATTAAHLIESAMVVPPVTRSVVRRSDIQELVSQSGSSRKVVDWQAPLILELMTNPCLAVNLPTIVLPDHMELTGQLVEQKGGERVSGQAQLDAVVGHRHVAAKETFVASSGKGRGFVRGMIEHRYTYHDQPATNWLEYDGKGTTNVVRPSYQAWSVSGGDQQPHDRSLDAEKQLFDAVRERLVQLCVEEKCGPHDVTGTLTVHSQIRMCSSCYMVALQFLAEFRNLKVTISRELPD